MKFIFQYTGYNLRNTEIGAVIGISQLKRLDKNIKLRNRNFNFFR
jgi:CDP-6-deoxy-D-xylo-4-hexulose-3-dehydrase